MKASQAKFIIPLVILLIVGLGVYSLLDDDGAPDTPVQPVAQKQGAGKVDSKSPQSNEEKITPKNPAFDLVRISRNGTGIIAGSAEPGALVSLYGDNKKLAEVKAESNGDWLIILSEPLKPGTIKFSVQSLMPGQEELFSEREVTVSVPEREGDKFLKDKKSGVVALLSRKDGKGPSKVLQRPGGPVFDDVGESLSISTLEYGAGQAFVNGKSLPRVDVRVYLDDQFLGTTKANDDGDWLLEMDKITLQIGKHIIRVDQTIGDGSVKLRIEQPFETGVPLDPSKASNGVIVEPGNTLWNIARQLYGSGVQYTMIFQENSEKIADPDLIYPGQVFKLPLKKKQ